MSRMLKIFFIALCVSLGFASDVPLKKTKNNQVPIKIQEDKVAVQIEDYKLMESTVNSWVNSEMGKTYHGKVSDEKKKELKKEAIKTLVKRELLFEYAKAQKVVFDKKIIDDIIKKNLEKFKTKEAFSKALANDGFTIETFKRDLDVEGTLRTLYTKLIRTDVSEKELKTYYEKNKFKFKKPESKKIQLILIFIDPTQKHAQKKAKEKIESLKKQAEEGVDFGKLARENSQDDSRINDGNVGFVHKGRFSNIKDEELEMEKDELKIIKTDTGFYLVKFLERKKAEQLSFAKVKKQLKEDLAKKYETEKIENILKSQKKKLRITYF